MSFKSKREAFEEGVKTGRHLERIEQMQKVIASFTNKKVESKEEKR